MSTRYPLLEELALRMRIAADTVVYDIENGLYALRDLEELQRRIDTLRDILEQQHPAAE